jgi:hypothetical protein
VYASRISSAMLVRDSRTSSASGNRFLSGLLALILHLAAVEAHRAPLPCNF